MKKGLQVFGLFYFFNFRMFFREWRNVGLEKPVANWAKHREADAEEYPVLRRWRKKVSPVAGALRGHSS